VTLQDTVSEWLRRWTRNPLGSARRGSNPLGVVSVYGLKCKLTCKIVVPLIKGIYSFLAVRAMAS
jgi:hypothetical protein